MSGALEALVREALKVLDGATIRLFTLPNVVAVGVGFKSSGEERTGEIAVTISVIRKVPLAVLAVSEVVPKKLGPVRTDVIETGEFLAFDDPRRRHRPARPGISVGHPRATAGTFGCLVRRGRDVFILSNNHVLANENDAQPGDPILQPGPADGGRDTDRIAELSDFVPLEYGGQVAATGGGCGGSISGLFRKKEPEPKGNRPGDNRVDAAIARLLDPAGATADILGIGAPTGVGDASLDLPVRKSGRTTGVTEGRIIQVGVTSSVKYGDRTAVFRNQLMAGPMSEGGDSGSAVLDGNGRVVGLLYAGTPTTTLINPIRPVLDALDVELVT